MAYIEESGNGNEAASLLQELERLRELLHRFVGGEYRPERLQEARELSDRLDELVVRYTRMMSSQTARGKGTEAMTRAARPGADPTA
ncbi:MAG: hypothetical protein ACYC5Y_11400 [Symbiobacteriia bacterium]